MEKYFSPINLRKCGRKVCNLIDRIQMSRFMRIELLSTFPLAKHIVFIMNMRWYIFGICNLAEAEIDGRGLK